MDFELDFSDIFSPQTIAVSLQSVTRYEAIEELVQLLDQAHLLKDVNSVLSDIVERENHLSTGLENGIAVPHGKSDGVTHLVGAIGISDSGIDFESLDGTPSNLIFLIVSPKDKSGPHLQALAQIVQNLKSKENRDQIIHSRSPNQIWEIVRTFKGNR